ncbi:hypothetical protein BD413DRAFT_603095 [Trametes elegans]|nr:hypothetical protein BD413DRAFT_603095 [Trametes elegans]
MTMLFLLCAGVLNLLNVALWWRQTTTTRGSQRDYCKLKFLHCVPNAFKGHDYPEVYPFPHEVPLVPVTLEETVHYLPLGVPSDTRYLALTTSSFGYIRLGPENRTLDVSMFHALHCVRMLNLAFSRPDFVDVGHAKHCLNYIRQDTLCQPDLALEPGDFEEKDLDVERAHGVHQCKDWGVIYHAVEHNYETWSKGTGYEYTPAVFHEMHEMSGH